MNLLFIILLLLYMDVCIIPLYAAYKMILKRLNSKIQTIINQRTYCKATQERGLKLDDALELAFNQFSCGYKRLVAEKKLVGEMKMQEGKSPITFQAYNFVAKEAVIATSDYDLACFSHLFLILCWTLMARSVSVGTVMLDRIHV